MQARDASRWAQDLLERMAPCFVWLSFVVLAELKGTCSVAEGLQMDLRHVNAAGRGRQSLSPFPHWGSCVLLVFKHLGRAEESIANTGTQLSGVGEYFTAGTQDRILLPKDPKLIDLV